MKPAVIMMYRDEADILPHSLGHWYGLGVRDFYLCDNLSVDRSPAICEKFKSDHPAARVWLFEDDRTDWPGRDRINALKRQAIIDGCDWIFPADADEFLQMPFKFFRLSDFCADILDDYDLKESDFCSFEIYYLNILPNGNTNWQEPQRKVFGCFKMDWIISMGNHLLENEKSIELNNTRCYYRHYSIRAYDQFKVKMINWWTAFHNSTMQDHPHAKHWHEWQRQGDAYIEQLYKELCG